MKRKFKQWWSTITLISTKQIINSRIKSLNINPLNRMPTFTHLIIEPTTWIYWVDLPPLMILNKTNLKPLIYFLFNEIWVEANMCSSFIVCLYLYSCCRFNNQVGKGWHPVKRINVQWFDARIDYLFCWY
jgi:hypothetical protein